MEWQDRRLRLNFKPDIKILDDFKWFLNHLNRSYGLKVMAETRYNEVWKRPAPKWTRPAPNIYRAAEIWSVFTWGRPVPKWGRPVPKQTVGFSRSFSEIQTDLIDRLKRQRNNRRDSATARSQLAAGSYQAVMENSWSEFILWVGDGPPPVGDGPFPKIPVFSSYKSETINRGPYPSLQNTTDPLKDTNLQ